ncbi:MAG: GNAT family N-acetyltransferase [Gemmatimonadaceae bacterium]|nr:GNAT family N-acetyltransferase [Gemmatimonadaceae bacterium]
MPGTIHIRLAVPADAPAIAAIYNEGIAGRGATFETTPRTEGDILGWFSTAVPVTEAGHPIHHPFLIAENRDERVVGWIRASAYRARACYAGIGDFSVYVAADTRGQRVGDTLMAAFLPACQEAGLWKVLSRIFPENAASLALCARHGFRVVGTYEAHAQLDGAWRDVVIVERRLV